jgi:hypothetical protein
MQRSGAQRMRRLEPNGQFLANIGSQPFAASARGKYGCDPGCGLRSLNRQLLKGSY